MEGLLARLGRGEVLVGDGAWGTLLMERGLREGRPPEWMALERPAVIEEVARLYVEAGADLVTTDTFGGTALRLRPHGLEGERERINRGAVETVRRAVAGRALVSASMGPTGRLLRPFGDVTAEEMEATFAEQAATLAAAGADVLCIETMTDLTEATCAVRAAKRAAAHLPVIATMTFEATPRGFFTVMGVSVPQAVAGLERAGADVVGANCGAGSEEMVAIAGELAQVARRPLAVQPNAGLPESRDGRVVYRESPGEMASRVPALLDLGVSLIGGCCGTTPEHVRALRRAVDARRAHPPRG